MLEISSFYTCAPKIKIICCMVPEMPSETDRIFCHLGPFFTLLPPSPSPTPLMIPKIKILKKKTNKKTKKCLEILSFYTCMWTINEDHMIYSSWNIRCNRQKYLSFWAICCPFSCLTTWDINILKMKKTSGDIAILHICTINDNHMMYGSWDMECDRQNFSHSRLFFAFLPLPFSQSRVPVFKTTGL